MCYLYKISIAIISRYFSIGSQSYFRRWWDIMKWDKKKILAYTSELTMKSNTIEDMG
jgi:ABC-type antimicrobial peptide transport system ATPase subunit